MKKIVTSLLILFVIVPAVNAQEAFTIEHYHVAVTVNKDASLNIKETINVNFTESRHGIIRKIPYKYALVALPAGTEKADRQLESNGYAKIIIEDIHVLEHNYSVSNSGSYKEIKIGSKAKYVDGQQQYIIQYKLLNAINFFKDHSELYLNIIGDQWNTQIDSATFSIDLYDALPATPAFFVATGRTGSQENNTVTTWTGNKLFTGNTTIPLQANQGLTVGISFPDQFLLKQNYMLRGMLWLLLPLFVFVLMFWLWRKWGKDATLPITTQYYPPDNISPSVAGYIIDDTLDKRDLTALIPYWGAGGYLQVKETEKQVLLGLIKFSEYEFIKLKELPPTVLSFEKTLFNGIFATGKKVKLESLKNVLYSTMNEAKRELEAEVDKSAYYESYSRGMVYFFIFIGVALFVLSTIQFVINWGNPFWFPVAVAISSIIMMSFGVFMAKKTPKGNALYQQLAGFKNFIQKVDKNRLALFLKEDEHYFDKVLPFAIVFDVADNWKDKLEGLDIPAPSWYVGNYHSYNAHNFLNSLDNSMNKMSDSFYSTPGSSGSSGGSFSSGGGGYSGGGFGGGGGSSW